MVRCQRDFLALFRRRRERVEAQVFHDLWTVRSCGKPLVAFPAAQGYRANPEQASDFGLEDSQLEPAPPQVAADGGRLFRDWNSTVVRR